MVAKRECRVCRCYDFSQSGDALEFYCKKGHFQFTEWSSGETAGKLPAKGSPGPAMPCDGSDFGLDENSRWYAYREKENRPTRTILIDITEFDKDESSRWTRVAYGFRWEHIENPIQTIEDFVADPLAFNDGEYKAILTEGQNARFLAYLKTRKYRSENFSEETKPRYLLAFSYGENPDVNMQLATIVQKALLQDAGSLKACVVQWEIANLLYERDGGLREVVHRIDLDFDRDYITSAEVVDKFKRFTKGEKSPKVFIVCQAWHAPRCIQICEKEGLDVVKGNFIDYFSRSDPQKWVRNWLAWVLKEGTKK